MEKMIGYWWKTVVDRSRELKVIEIYLGEDGLYKVYTDRKPVALVFGSWDAIKERFPIDRAREDKRIILPE